MSIRPGQERDVAEVDLGRPAPGTAAGSTDDDAVALDDDDGRRRGPRPPRRRPSERHAGQSRSLT